MTSGTGETAGKYVQWDMSADALVLAGGLKSVYMDERAGPCVPVPIRVKGLQPSSSSLARARSASSFGVPFAEPPVMISLRTVCIGLALAVVPAGCLPHSGTVPPPPERLRIEGSADASGPVRLAWDAPDPRWDLGPIDYRVRVVRHDDGSVAYERTTVATSVDLPAAALSAGVRYRVEVSSGNGARSRARTIVFEPGPDLDRDGIDDRLEERLAATFAPELHFNREVPGDPSLQNRSELYFPSSIESFDAALHSAWVSRTDPKTGRTTKVPNPSGGRPTLFFRNEWERRPLGNLSGDDDRAADVSEAGRDASALATPVAELLHGAEDHVHVARVLTEQLALELQGILLVSRIADLADAVDTLVGVDAQDGVVVVAADHRQTHVRDLQIRRR